MARPFTHPSLLMALSIKRRTFFAASLTQVQKFWESSFNFVHLKVFVSNWQYNTYASDA